MDEEEKRLLELKAILKEGLEKTVEWFVNQMNSETPIGGIKIG